TSRSPTRSPGSPRSCTPTLRSPRGWRRSCASSWSGSMGEHLTLADVCLQITDCEHKTAPAAPRGTEYGYSVGTPCIKNGRLLLDAAKRVDRATYEKWTARAVPQKDDIILTREAPVGEAALLDGNSRV